MGNPGPSLGCRCLGLRCRPAPPRPCSASESGLGVGRGGGSSPPHRAEDEKHQAKGERGMDRDTPGFAQGAPSKTQIPFVIP